VAEVKKKATKIKIKRGDRVIVIAGKDKNKKGKVLVVDRKNNRIVVEGVNMVSKHMKPRGQEQQGGIVKKEAPLHASNVMFLHKDKPTRIGYKIETKEVDGKKVTVKTRIAKSTGEAID
jgi:large subunit ribosomal protein L24